MPENKVRTLLLGDNIFWGFAVGRYRDSMGEKFAKIIYLVAISLATVGWLWLLVQATLALLGEV